MDSEPTTSGDGLIRVFVRAGAALELAGLEAVVKSASFLQLAGSSLGRTQLDVSVAALGADVILERPLLNAAEDSQLAELLAAPGQAAPARLWILDEAEFEPALAALQEGGVRALLPDWATSKEIQTAVQAVAAGLVVLHPDIAEHTNFRSAEAGAAGNTPSPIPGQQLSPREGEVLNLLAAGLANKQIADRLGISEHTVKFHVTSIFNKLGASSRAEAVAIGARRGLIIL